MVVLDATTLLLFLSPLAEAPLDPVTKIPIDLARERVAHLVRTLEAKRVKIIIPTPALSEVLVRAGRAGQDYVRTIERSAAFRIEPFCARAAVEVAIMTRDAMDVGNKRGEGDGTWAKIKYDRQIVAIAKVHNVEAIYSDDANVRSFATKHEIPVIGLRECPVPTEEKQTSIEFGDGKKTEGQSSD